MDRPDVTGALAAVRRQIDAVDRDLVEALARRQHWVEMVAVLKGDPGQVRDAGRADEVLAKVREAALRAGLSPAVAEPLWRVMMELWVAHQLELLEHRQPD